MTPLATHVGGEADMVGERETGGVLHMIGDAETIGEGEVEGKMLVGAITSSGLTAGRPFAGKLAAKWDAAYHDMHAGVVLEPSSEVWAPLALLGSLVWGRLLLFAFAIRGSWAVTSWACV